MIVSFERDILNVLSDYEEEITESLKISFQTVSVEDCFPDFLDRISDILFEASKTYSNWNLRDSELQFSFFPGYVSNSGKRVFKNGTIKINYRNGNIISFETNSGAGGNINLDYNHDLKYGERSTKISLLALAYHFLFISDGAGAKCGTFDLMVGGTHQWASKISDIIALNDSLDPLELLAFYDDMKDARENQLKYDKWINIPFNIHNGDNADSIQENIYSWCENVVDKMDYPSNFKSKEDLKFKWPYNPGCRSKMNGSKQYDKYEKDILIFRAYNVAFWMLFVFRPRTIVDVADSLIGNASTDNDIFKAWFDFPKFYMEKTLEKHNAKNIEFLQKGVNKRVKQINRFKKILLNPKNQNKIYAPKYSYWYTVPFKHRLSFSDKRKNVNASETGSAMILSNYMLDEEYFRFVIPWLERMYDAMREYDTAFNAKINAESTYKAAYRKALEDHKVKTASDIVKSAETYVRDVEPG